MHWLFACFLCLVLCAMIHHAAIFVHNEILYTLFAYRALLCFPFVVQGFRAAATLHYARWRLYRRIVSLPVFLCPVMCPMIPHNFPKQAMPHFGPDGSTRPQAQYEETGPGLAGPPQYPGGGPFVQEPIWTRRRPFQPLVRAMAGGCGVGGGKCGDGSFAADCTLCNSFLASQSHGASGTCLKCKFVQYDQGVP